MTNLAATYCKQGRWREAEELKVKVLEARSRILGEDHHSTLAAMVNLAATYHKEVRWKEAEELEVKVIKASSRLRGWWMEAEELEVKVVGVMLRVLGEEHADTLTVMGNLAATHDEQGRWEEVAKLQFQVIEAS
ncbi:hypothetical protein LTR02_018091 [Friedmanniomyces endolithicus]|nr:hypothetical protein LTR02_018091 [Friedmanniomyces endolithicus]